MRRLYVATALLALAACKADPAQTKPHQEATPPTTTPPPFTPSSNMTEEIIDVPSLNVQCGMATARIGFTGPTSTEGSYVTADGKVTSLQTPKGLENYTPVGLGCSAAAQGETYLIVQFGEFPEGCQFCEWFALYDATGKLLTSNTPPFYGEGRDRSPNNDEYEKALANHQLKHPAIEFAEL